VDNGRALLDDFEPEGFSAGAVGNTSDTTVAELFLEVMVRHVPGRMAERIKRPSRSGSSRLCSASLSGMIGFDPVFSGQTWPDSDESAVCRES
jgi:hypothetical protein